MYNGVIKVDTKLFSYSLGNKQQPLQEIVMPLEERKIKIYIVSEDSYIQDYAVLILVGENYDVKLYAKQSDVIAALEKDSPDLLISDFKSENINGLELCKAVRKIPLLSYLPLIFLLEPSGPEQLNKAKLVYAGADDYIQKSVLEEELILRVKLSLYRISRQQDINPLSRLPGQASLMKELKRHIEAKNQIAVCCADLFQFKHYNHRYGFRKGDEVIKFTGALILKALRELGSSSDFLAHPDADNFFFITVAEAADAIAKQIITEFESGVGALYDAHDRQQGVITFKDRKGEVQKIPLARIHLGIVTNEHYPFIDPPQVVQIATELKDFAQNNFEKSMYVKERRKEWPFS